MVTVNTSNVTQCNGKFFYGWIITIAATLIYGIGSTPIVCFGLFVKPMALELGWNRGIVTGAFGAYMLIMGVLGIGGGLLVDRVGPKISIFMGGILMSLGLFICSRISSVSSYYFGFSIIMGAGWALIFVPLQTTVTRWFVDKKGLALGIMFSGYGIAGFILSPILQSIIDSNGWRIAFAILSIILLCIVLPSALFLKKDPSEVGLMPLGEIKSNLKGSTKKISIEKRDMQFQKQDYTVLEAMKTGAFWLFNLAVVFMMLGYFMAQVNMVPHATDKGLPTASAAFAMGIFAAFKSFGTLSIGSVSDKIGTKRALGFCLLLGTIVLFWLIFVRQPWMMYLFSIFFGLAYGGSMPQIPRLSSELFGLKSMGGIMGVSMMISTLGTSLGPVLGGAIYDRVGNYGIAFAIGSVIILISFIFLVLLKVPVSGGVRLQKEASISS